MLLIWLHGLLVAHGRPAKELYQGLIAIGNTKMAGGIVVSFVYTLLFLKLSLLLSLIRFNTVTLSMLNLYIKLVYLIDPDQSVPTEKLRMEGEDNSKRKCKIS